MSPVRSPYQSAGISRTNLFAIIIASALDGIGLVCFPAIGNDLWLAAPFSD